MLTGTAMPSGLTASQIVNSEILLTLQLDQRTDVWLPNTRTDPDLRLALARRVRSLQVEPNGWNEVVQQALLNSFNWFSSAGSADLTLRVPSQPQYSISSPETIEVSVPGLIVASGLNRLSTPASFVVFASGGSVSLEGSIFDSEATADGLSVRARDLRSAHTLTLRITLAGDSFLPAVGQLGEATSAVLQGIFSAQTGRRGWNALMQPVLDSSLVSRPDERSVELQIPQAAG